MDQIPKYQYPVYCVYVLKVVKRDIDFALKGKKKISRATVFTVMLQGCYIVVVVVNNIIVVVNNVIIIIVIIIFLIILLLLFIIFFIIGYPRGRGFQKVEGVCCS